MSSDKNPPLRVDAQELLICENPDFACETYIFEPSPEEEKLGYLFAAAETQSRDGVGKELLDVVLSAIQNEYFRDPSRSPVHSFELALHQANLILHDSAEKGVKDWMGYFHVAIGALTGSQLHISVAGNAGVWLARKASIANIADGLSHMPITNPLRTFSQVASGDISTRDTIFFTTPYFAEIFRPEDVARFTIEHSAATISSRLQQLYKDQKQVAPLGLVTVSMLPQYVVNNTQHTSATPTYKQRSAADQRPETLQPRKPLVIHKTAGKKVLHGIGYAISTSWNFFLTHAWPHLRKGSRQLGSQAQKGGLALFRFSKKTGQSLAAKTKNHSIVMPGQSLQAAKESVQEAPGKFIRSMFNMPLTSKIFAGIALLLLITLGVSVVLLQSKRTEDKDIQRASELLHEAKTNQEAAETALIYDNREQASKLLDDAADTLKELKVTGLYTQEVTELEGKIQSQNDRLQKITRAKTDSVTVIGSFEDVSAKTAPTSLFYVNDKLFSYNPETNAILSMDLSGNTAITSSQTKEIGFLKNGTVHTADKTIILSTSDPAIALFDTKDNSLTKQDVAFTQDNPSLSTIAVFGNRLYAYDPNAKNIFVYNKTLRGYVNGAPWITDDTFPKDNIKSISVDGSIYTLHTDGSVRELFKGAAATFKAEPVEPSLSTATKILTNEDLKNIYIMDPANKRIVIITKKGALVRQVFFEDTVQLQDFSVDPKEQFLYALDGKQVLRVSLTAGN